MASVKDKSGTKPVSSPDSSDVTRISYHEKLPPLGTDEFPAYKGPDVTDSDTSVTHIPSSTDSGDIELYAPGASQSAYPSASSSGVHFVGTDPRKAAQIDLARNTIYSFQKRMPLFERSNLTNPKHEKYDSDYVGYIKGFKRVLKSLAKGQPVQSEEDLKILENANIKTLHFNEKELSETRQNEIAAALQSLTDYNNILLESVSRRESFDPVRYDPGQDERLSTADPVIIEKNQHSISFWKRFIQKNSPPGERLR